MSECSLRHCGRLRKFQVSTRRTLRVRVTHALRCVSALRIARWGSLEGPTQGLQTLGGRGTRTIRPAQAPGRRIGARLPGSTGDLKRLVPGRKSEAQAPLSSILRLPPQNGTAKTTAVRRGRFVLTAWGDPLGPPPHVQHLGGWRSSGRLSGCWVIAACWQFYLQSSGVKFEFTLRNCSSD